MQYPLRSAFLALPLEGEDRHIFSVLQDALRDWHDILTFQSSETAHLTLYYWESVMQIEHAQMRAHATRVSSMVSPFTLSLDGAGTFGDLGRETVLFLAPVFSPELAYVKKLLPWPNIRPFRPHITIARIRRSQAFSVQRKSIMKRVERNLPDKFSFDRMRFYASMEGRAQTPLEDFPFTHSPHPPPAGQSR